MATIFVARMLRSLASRSRPKRWRRGLSVPNSSTETAQVRQMTAADLPQVMKIAASLPEAPHWPESAYLDALNPELTPRRIALVAAGQQPVHVEGFAVAR